MAQSKRIYKHKLLAEMREKGELDTEIYNQIKAEQSSLKKLDSNPRAFPTVAAEMKYPEPVLNKDNPLYVTSSN